LYFPKGEGNIRRSTLLAQTQPVGVLRKVAAFVELDLRIVLIDSPAHRAMLPETVLQTYFSLVPAFGGRA